MAELKKNTALRWVFKMVDATDGLTPETGVSVTVQVSLDGAAFAGLTGSPSVSEISDGWYYVDVVAGDMNADVVVLKATATGCAQTEEKLYPPVKNVNDLNDFDYTSEAVTIEDNGITAAKIAESGGDALADYVLRRSYANARTSSYGDTLTFRSLIGAVAMLVNKKDASSGSSLVVYHEDDSTTFETSSITSDAASNPITVVDPS